MPTSSPLSTNTFLNERGVFPILILVAIGVALVAGGTYAVKNNLVTTKGGQVVFNGGKDKSLSDAKIPAPENDIPNSPQPLKKVDLSEKIAEYKPETGEPKFSITPPAGWVKGETGGKVKITYEGSQEDKKEFGNGGYISSAPNIQVTVEKSANIKNLDDAIAEVKSQSNKVSEVQIELITEKKTTFNGMEAYYTEFYLSLPNIDYNQLREYLKQQGKSTSTENIEEFLKEAKAKAVSYLLFKDGYTVALSGVALNSAWDKRSPLILASFNSFKFLDDIPKSPIPTQKSKFSNPWTNTTNVFPDKIAPVKFSMKELPDWEKSVVNTANEKDYTLFLQGKEESETGKGGQVLKIQPGIYIDMRYNPSTNLEEQISVARAVGPTTKIPNEKQGTFFGEMGYFMESIETDYKTGLPIKNQSYTFYKDKYVITISIHSLQSTWDKWYPVMKTVIESFKFE